MKKFLQKKILIPFFILLLALGYYLVLPAFIVVEKNQEISDNVIVKVIRSSISAVVSKTEPK